MAVKVTAVDCAKLKSTATTIRSLATDGVASNLNKIYEQIENLGVQNKWKGESYDKLYTFLTQHSDELQKQLQYLENSIPRTLEKIANRYSIADTGDSIAVEEAHKATDLSLSNSGQGSAETKEGGVNLVFQSEAVDFVQKNITSYFNSILGSDNASGNLGEIEKAMDGLTEESWNDDVSSQFRAQFKTDISKIRATILNMKTEFLDAIAKATDNITKAESKSTVQEEAAVELGDTSGVQAI